MVVQVDALEVAADVHAAHDVTLGSTEGHPASHPLLARLSSSNLLASQVTAVHVSLSEHVSQVPLATVGQPTSQPSAASLLVLNLLAEHAARQWSFVLYNHGIVCFVSSHVWCT